MSTAFLYSNSGGGTGGTLTVTAPAGATVTVTKDGKTKTKVADSSGLAVFKGLASGEWTISITDGEQTAQKTVTITADYAAEITFFAATIHITCPEGSTCTATDGTTTLTAPDTSGTWECVVPNAGTWTVSCTNGTYTANFTVSITSNGQNSTAKLSYDQYLFKNGNQYTNITGGWVSQGYYQQSSTTGTGAGTLSVVNNILTLTEPDSSWHIAGTRDKVDLSGYSTLRFVISAVNASDAYLAARDDGRYVFPFPSIRQTCSSPGTYDIDISSANSSYYIQFYRCNVSEVLLKR